MAREAHSGTAAGFVKLVALIHLTSLSIVLTSLWSVALVQGGATTVHIDVFGEMWIEYAVFLVTWPIASVGLYLLITEETG